MPSVLTALMRAGVALNTRLYRASGGRVMCKVRRHFADDEAKAKRTIPLALLTPST